MSIRADGRDTEYRKGGGVTAEQVWRVAGARVLLRVKVTPNAALDEVTGLVATPSGPAIAVRVRAVPDEGRANAATIKLVADWLGLAKSCVALTAGAKSRMKTLALEGDAVFLERLVAVKVGGCDMTCRPTPEQ
jgi:uncharacterized protein YggU (UPF0235/DUF167 family)